MFDTTTNSINSTLNESVIITIYSIPIGFSVFDTVNEIFLFTSTASEDDYNLVVTPNVQYQIQDFDQVATNICNDMVAEFLGYPVLIGLLGLIILLGAVIFGISSGFINISSINIDGSAVSIGLVTVIVLGVLVIVGIFMLSSLCLLF